MVVLLRNGELSGCITVISQNESVLEVHFAKIIEVRHFKNVFIDSQSCQFNLSLNQKLKLMDFVNDISDGLLKLSTLLGE